MQKITTINLAAALIAIAATSLPVALPAAVPIRWTVESSRVQPAQFEGFHGETIEFAATVQSYGKPLATTNDLIGIYWQTNGMGAAYWTAPAVLSNNVMIARWEPAMDVGANVYSCFIGVPGEIYRAAFQLRLRPSPGAVPSELPLPVKTLDFAQVQVLNPPYYTRGETDARIIELASTPGNYSIVSNRAMTALQEHQSLNDYYTRGETDARIIELAPAPGDYATVSNRAMTALQEHQSLDDYYTRGETDARIIELAPAPGDYETVSNRAMTALQEHQSLDDYYTRGETDARIIELAPAPGNYETVSNRAMTALQEHQSLADYQPMLTAGANISIDTNTWVISASGEGGTTDYDELANKPSIGGVVLSNDVTLARLGAASTGDLEDRVRFEWKTEHIDDETTALTNEWYDYNEGGVPYRHHVLIQDIKTQYPDTVMQLFPDFASFYVQTGDVTEVITDLHTHDSVTNTFYVNTSLEARGMSRIPLVQHIHQEQPGYAQDITLVQENLLFAGFNAALHPQSTNEYLLGRVLRYIIQEASDVGTVTDNCNYVEIGFGINNDTGRTAVYYGSVNRKDLAFVDDLASCATTNDISHLSPRFSNEVLAVAESLIPAKVSDLTNDVGYITAETDPTVVSATNLIWQTLGDVNLLLETALGD